MDGTTDSQSEGFTVSVCMVSAGRAELIDALDSLAKQTVPPHEVLVLIDSDKGLAERIAGDYPGIKVGLFSMFTLGGARNRIVEASMGDLLVFLDDDVVAPPEFIENLVELAHQHPDVDVFGGPNLTLPDVAWREALVGDLLGNFVATGPFARRFRASSGVSLDLEDLVLCNLAVRRSGWQPFLESLSGGEETEFLHRLGHQGIGIMASPELMVWHRRRREMADVFEQMRRYGRGRSAAVREQSSALKPAATGAVVLLAIGAVVRGRLPVLYLLAVLALGCWESFRFGTWRAGTDTIALTLVIHGGYSLGFAEGFVRSPHSMTGESEWLNAPLGHASV